MIDTFFERRGLAFVGWGTTVLGRRAWQPAEGFCREVGRKKLAERVCLYCARNVADLRRVSSGVVVRKWATDQEEASRVGIGALIEGGRVVEVVGGADAGGRGEWRGEELAVDMGGACGRGGGGRRTL